MRSFLEGGATRAGLFFAVAFLASTLLGVAIGDPRAGLRSGVLVGLAAAVFAYAFVRPAEEDEVE